MSNDLIYNKVMSNLQTVFEEMRVQNELSVYYPSNVLPFDKQMVQLDEYINDYDEFGIAYELIICNLEHYPFILKGTTVVKLVEVALLMGYKTDREEDEIFTIIK